MNGNEEAGLLRGLAPGDRAKSLANMMSAEEIFPLLWAGAAAAGIMGTITDDLSLIKGSRAGVASHV